MKPLQAQESLFCVHSPFHGNTSQLLHVDGNVSWAAASLQEGNLQKKDQGDLRRTREAGNVNLSRQVEEEMTNSRQSKHHGGIMTVIVSTTSTGWHLIKDKAEKRLLNFKLVGGLKSRDYKSAGEKQVKA